jgi:hypothetical protein
MEAQLVRSGDIGDEAGRSTADAGPLDLDAVRADDDLIEALSAGLVPPPSGKRDTSDIEGELVALLAGWVADVRPETLLHRPAPPLPVCVDATPESAEDALEEVADDVVPIPAFSFGTASLLEHNELPRPVALASWRSTMARPYLLRAAAALVAVALVSSGVVARSYGAHPGEPLWAITQVAFPAKSHSVEAAISVSTALNTARVALERGRIEEARQAFQTVAAQLADVDPADGRAELDQQMSYVTAQLAANPAMDSEPASPIEAGQRQLATGAVGAVIPSSPAVTPGAAAALAAPSTAPSVPASGPNVTSQGSPAPGGTSPPPAAVLADPAPSGAVSDVPAPVVVNSPPADRASNNAPPVVSDPATDPAASASTTTEQPAPTTDPPANQSPTDPPTQPDTPDPVDTGTADHGDPASAGDTAADSTPAGGGSDGSTSGGSSNSADNSANSQDNAIDTNGAAGSNLGQVTGVVTNTSDSGS